jgi:hypothetical protein
MEIADCGLPIADWEMGTVGWLRLKSEARNPRPEGNLKSEIRTSGFAAEPILRSAGL